MRWKIEGADSRNGAPARTEFEARTEQEARDLAAYNGIYVRTVEPKVSAPRQRQAATALSDMSALDALAAAAGGMSDRDRTSSGVLDYRTPAPAGQSPPAMPLTVGAADGGEEILFSGGNVHVTPSRVIIGPTTYALRNITSVSMGSFRSDHNNIGGPLLVIGGGVGTIALAADAWLLAGVFLAIGAVGLVVLLRPGKRRTTLRFGTSAGESDVLVSADDKFIYDVAEAVNPAIIRRG